MSKFGRFLVLQVFRGRAFQKLYPYYHPGLAHVVCKKFRKDIPTGPEVVGAQTLNFMPNFKFSPLKFFWGTPVPDGGALGSLGQSLARVKI